ncbi:MAG: hypothetical protein LBK60_06775, partial [Verrucomicrobiales bacterium]|nr:hypothetical protein [Verrucomicrobiales bacterium]
MKGWPRSGRGSLAFEEKQRKTLNYPVGSRRHPFTEGESLTLKSTPLTMTLARANSPSVKQLCCEKRLLSGFERDKGVAVEVGIEVDEELAHD